MGHKNDMCSTDTNDFEMKTQFLIFSVGHLRIEKVKTDDKECRILFQSSPGAYCLFLPRDRIGVDYCLAGQDMAGQIM